MDISQSSGEIVFRTPYSDQYNLLQFFRGIKKGTNSFNCPVSFHTAGFQRKDHPDLWHVDVVLSFATDECTPQVINGTYIGANHGWPGAVVVHAPGHDKTAADVGALWQDESGLQWTLMRVEDEENLLFLSENTGESNELFAFSDHITGTLSYVSHGAHPSAISVLSQRGGAQLFSANRYRRRAVYAWKDGRRFLVPGTVLDVDCAEIVEEYEIINPVTVADALRADRPAGGYPADPDLAVGEAMLLHRVIYRVLGDGTILVLFDHERLQDVRWSGTLGIMYQEKNDVGAGGIWRVIPALKPVRCDGKTFDFSVPYNTTGGDFPSFCPLPQETWENPDCPPDHQLDFIHRADGTCLAAFAGGYLPVYDGHPSVRAKNIQSAATLIETRKTYPNFAGDLRIYPGAVKDMPTMERSRGVGYRRYFQPEREGCCTNVYPFEDHRYVVMDFYGKEETVQSYDLPENSACRVVSCTGAAVQILGNTVTATASRGTVLLDVGP